VTLRLRVKPGAGEAFQQECRGPAVVLGRSNQADIVIPDPHLSRLHARLLQEGDAWLLQDLGSKNPTLLNGQALSGPTPVHVGDVLQLGGTLVYVEAEDGGGAPTLPSRQLRRPVDDETLIVSASTRVRLEPETAADELGEAALRRHSGRLRMLNDVHRALARPITLDALLELILDRAFADLRPEAGVVLLREPGGGFRRAASRTLEGAQEVPASRRLLQEVVENGMALVVDAATDPRFASSRSLVSSGLRSVVAAPLLDDDGCLGVIVLASQLHRRFSEEDMELLVSLASAAALRIRSLELAEETARRRILDNELQLAHDIQMALLPRRFPCRDEFELAATLRPASSVGGDLYDFVAEGRRLFFIVGDVAGKGVAAALLMAVTKTLFHAVAEAGTPVSEILARVNQDLARDNERGMFVTALAGSLDLAGGELELGNAGHLPAYRLGAEGSVEPLRGQVGVPLGVLDGTSYVSERILLTHGDALFLYTDGVIEALNGEGEPFGVARLERYLRASATAAAPALVDGALSALREFTGQAAQFDDVTVLALRYLRRAG
jgi:serine phosphatase RsbU (regulator of sigma subunit)